MARGILSGVIWGGVVSTIAAGGLSLMTPLPDRVAPQPETGTAEVPAGSGFEGARDDTAAELPAPSGDVPGADASDLPVLAPDDLAALTGDERAPAAAPETGTPDAQEMSAPEAGGASGVDLGGGDAPVAPSVQSSPPAVPPSETRPEVDTGPALPPPPSGDDSAFPEVGSTAEETPAPMPEPAAEAPATAPVEDGVATAVPGEPAGTIADLAPNVQTNRGEADAPTAAAPPNAPPPIERFAVQTEDPGDRPLFSVVLIDDGQGALGPEALAGFPYPLTIALDAGQSGAAELMQDYRDLGFEIMAMAGLPDAASPQDVEITLEAALTALPEAVGVMETPDLGLQGSREVSDQVTTWVADSGHGLLLFPNGLDTARKLATRDGVPAATVFRDFDGDGQDAATIRRFLDGAAFRAAQEGGVVMVGRMRPDTISALLLWGLQDRASRVALVPVSQVLTSAAPE